MAIVDSQALRRANGRIVRRAFDTPMLSREHEMELGIRWREKEDISALRELVSSHIRLVVSLVSRHKGYGMPQSDLFQEGTIGLIEAATRFDPRNGARLSTYATWWIRASMQSYILRNWSVVRMGTTATEKSLFFNLRRLRAKIASSDGSKMSWEERQEIARDLGVHPDAVESMECRLSGDDQSLNAGVGDDPVRQKQDALCDDRMDPEATVMERHDEAVRNRWLEEALQQLPPREALIIRRRHLGEETETLRELGDQLGISKERVRQIERRALDRLQRSLTHSVEQGHGGADGLSAFGLEAGRASC